MANITRNTFLASKGVLRKVLQKGVYVLDSDWNEQMDVLLDEIQKGLGLTFNNSSYRIGDGFKLVGTGIANQITAKAGWGVFKLSDGRCIALNNTSDLAITGFSTATTTLKVDYVYIDIFIDEINSSEDANIVNPDVGSETCVDKRVSWSIGVSQEAVPSAPATNHYRVTLGTADIIDNVWIDAWKVQNFLKDWNQIVGDIQSGNLLKNTRFNIWDATNNIAKFWPKSSGSVGNIIISTQGTYTKFGGSSALCTGGGVGGGYDAQQILDEELSRRLRGKKIKVGIWVAGSAHGSESVTLSINDGTTSDFVVKPFGHLAAGTFTLIEVQHIVSNTATAITINIAAGLAVGTYSWYLDAAYSFAGEVPDRTWEPSFWDLNNPTEKKIDDLVADDAVILYTSQAESFTAADAVSLTDATKRHTVTDSAGAGTARIMVRIPYAHFKSFKKLGVAAYLLATAGTGTVRLKIQLRTNDGSIERGNAETTPINAVFSGASYYVKMDCSTEVAEYALNREIWITMTATGTSYTVVASHIVIYALKA